MELFIGGAYAGKRKVVKSKQSKLSWLSTYQGNSLQNWYSAWGNNTELVIEGWENWIIEQVKNNKDDHEIRIKNQIFLENLVKEEQTRQSTVILIMLEIGKGIVPLGRSERRSRDLSGWLLQDAAEYSESVTYVWHGLSKRLK